MTSMHAFSRRLPGALAALALAVVTVTGAAMVTASSALALDAAQVPQAKQTKPGLYVDAKGAHALK